ncbi:MAG: hypothetical protein ABIA75_01030 [Candidatus Neomarinimicrobiota bacterium]
MPIRKIILLLSVGGGLFCQEPTILPESIFEYQADQAEIHRWVENQGIYIENPAWLENVYYLMNVEREKGVVHVGYFLDWENEFPDFGRRFKTTPVEIVKQFFLPLVYTNFLYIPNSGGIQQVQFGKHDVEGIYARYSFDDSGLTGLLELRFEIPEHKEINIPNYELKIELDAVSQDGIPWVRVASWNHLFLPPEKNDQTNRFKLKLFPKEIWQEYNMDRKRAEVGKRYLILS